MLIAVGAAIVALFTWRAVANWSSSSDETSQEYTRESPHSSVSETSTPSADLEREEREFGEYGYKSMRAVVEQSCSCGKDGACTLKISRVELRDTLSRFTDSLKTTMPRLWPELTKKMESMSTADGKAYGERLGQEHLNRLPRDEVLLWSRMLTSCWQTSAEPRKAAPTSSKPHDGSLDKSGDISDLKNGKMDEPGGIAEFVASCRRSTQGNPNADPFCGCLSDYLRVSPPSVIETFRRASETGDASEMRDLPGVKRCTNWLTTGGEVPNPFLRKGMKSSLDVERAFARCRTQLEKGKTSPSGIVFCNRLVATTP
jgi:hypothetical protein